MLTLNMFRTHAEAFVATIGGGVEHEWAKAVNALVTFVEGKSAEADAIYLLTKAGYTITRGGEATEALPAA